MNEEQIERTKLVLHSYVFDLKYCQLKLRKLPFYRFREKRRLKHEIEIRKQVINGLENMLKGRL